MKLTYAIAIFSSSQYGWVATMGANEWMAIINAHIKWKQRLAAYIENSGEKLDAEAVASGHNCALGQWIEDHKAQFGSVEIFEIVRLHHVDFHQKAGEVVKLVDEGREAEASQLLHGSYMQISEQLKRGKTSGDEPNSKS